MLPGQSAGRCVWPVPGKMNWDRVWALLHFPLTALLCLGIGNNTFLVCLQDQESKGGGRQLHWGCRTLVCTFPRAWPCSTFPQNLSVGCSLAAVHVTLSSIPWHLREMQFSNVACRFLFWVTLQVLSLNTVSHMHACFPAHTKKEWARTKLLASIQFPWSDRCCICRYSPCPHPHGGLGRNLSWAWREHWAEGNSLWWACRSPCYWADGSPVSSQLEVFHVHGSIPKYKEF